jgi:hypothetical protein
MAMINELSRALTGFSPPISASWEIFAGHALETVHLRIHHE